MYRCCNCDSECSGMGRCTKCSGALCFLCAEFVKDGREASFLTKGGKPYCEKCAKDVKDAHDEGEHTYCVECKVSQHDVCGMKDGCPCCEDTKSKM
jgi:hypothetical protein